MQLSHILTIIGILFSLGYTPTHTDIQIDNIQIQS